MKLNEIIDTAHVGKATLTLDQKREIRARLRFAEIPEDTELSDAETAIVDELVMAVASPIPRERTAFPWSWGNCPRCNAPVSTCKLADQSDAAYCNSCHVVVPN